LLPIYFIQSIYEHIAGRAAGTSIDWAKGAMFIPLSFIIELRDRGEKGFLLPESEILPTGQELWAGVEALISHIVLGD
jgi:hypothetical protein